MSLWSKIRGTTETLFQLGIGGTQLKNNSGVIEARDSTDAAYVKVRCLDPAAANDAATKNYVDTGTLGGAVREIRYALGTTATQDSTTIIPANAVITKVQVSITTPYSGGATIAVGQAGTTNLLMGTSDNNPQTTGIYEINEDVAWGGSPLAVRTTVGGSPGAGVGVCIVHYTTPAV
jgi:hypothetical protein